MISKEKKKKLMKELEISINWKETDYELIDCKVVLKNLSPEEKNRASMLALDKSGNTIDDLIEHSDEEIDEVEDKKEPIKKEDIGKELSKDKKDDKNVKKEEKSFNNPQLFNIAMEIYVAIESIYLKDEKGKKEKAFDVDDFDEFNSISETSHIWKIIKEANEYNQNDLKKK